MNVVDVWGYSLNTVLLISIGKAKKRAMLYRSEQDIFFGIEIFIYYFRFSQLSRME